MTNLAVVDLGSNSVRMGIYRVENGHFREVKRVRSRSRLASQMGPKKILQPDAVQRTMRALAAFRAVWERYPDLRVIGLATAAVRQARNQRSFLRQIKRRFGISVRVVSGQQEADYDYLGVCDRVTAARYLIMDVGGGSIELVGVNHNKHTGISLPIGAVSISEHYHLNDRVSGCNLFRAQTKLAEWFNQVTWLDKFARVPAVLLGGAHRSLNQMGRRFYGLDRNVMNRDQLIRIYAELLTDDLRQRRNVPGLEPGRADVIVGGLLPLTMIMNRLGLRRMLFSKSSARRGAVKQYLK